MSNTSEFLPMDDTDLDASQGGVDFMQITAILVNAALICELVMVPDEGG